MDSIQRYENQNLLVSYQTFSPSSLLSICNVKDGEANDLVVMEFDSFSILVLPNSIDSGVLLHNKKASIFSVFLYRAYNLNHPDLKFRSFLSGLKDIY